MSAKRLCTWGLILVTIGFAYWYCNQVLIEPEVDRNVTTRVFFVTGGTDDFWQLAVKGAEAASREYQADLQVRMPKQSETLEEQQKILLSLETEKLDGLALSPLSAEQQTRLINDLVKKVNVVTFDSDAPFSERQYYVGTSNYRAGQLCYELVQEALPEGGKCVALLSNLAKNNMIERKAGYEDSERSTAQSEEGDALKWQTVEYLIDGGERSRIEDNIRHALEEHEDVKVIVGMNGYHGPAMLEVIEDMEMVGEVKLVAFDEAEKTLDGVAAGHIYGTIAQDPYKYGYEAVRMLTSLQKGKSRELPIVGRGAINVNCQAIRQADVEDFRKRLKERLGQNGDGLK